MTPEQHVSHAAAVKLMEDKDYFVALYTMILGKLMDHCGLNPNYEKNGFNVTVTIDKMVPLAEALAKKAMVPITNYGKTE